MIIAAQSEDRTIILYLYITKSVRNITIGMVSIITGYYAYYSRRVENVNSILEQ